MEEKIKQLKDWAMENYSKGTDFMIECWGTEEWTNILNHHDNDVVETIETLKKMSYYITLYISISHIYT